MRHVRTAILGLMIVGGTLAGSAATALAADSPAPLPIGGPQGGLTPPLPINAGAGQLPVIGGGK